MDFDRLSLKTFVLSITFVVVFIATVAIAWFFSIDLESVELWIGASIVYLTAAFIFTAPFYYKIAASCISIFAMGYFMHQVFDLFFSMALLFGLVLVIFILFTYLAL